jgi:hypothetical protein
MFLVGFVVVNLYGLIWQALKTIAKNMFQEDVVCNMELKDGIDYDSPEAENPDNYIEKLDEKGRRLPCVEYFEIPLDLHNDKEYIDLVLKSYKDEDWKLWDFSEYE